MDALTSSQFRLFGAEISRRDVLKAGGALIVSFAFGVAPRQGAAQVPVRSTETGRPLDPGEVDGLLAIHADGSVTRVHQQGGCRDRPAHGAGADGGRGTWRLRRREST